VAMFTNLPAMVAEVIKERRAMDGRMRTIANPRILIANRKAGEAGPVTAAVEIPAGAAAAVAALVAEVAVGSEGKLPPMSRTYLRK